MYLADSAFLVLSETIDAQGSFANTEVGEIKSTFKYSSSVKQLGIRLAVLNYGYQSVTRDMGFAGLLWNFYLNTLGSKNCRAFGFIYSRVYSRADSKREQIPREV